MDLRSETAHSERSDIGSQRSTAGIVDHRMRSPRIWSQTTAFVVRHNADHREGLSRRCTAGDGHPVCALLLRMAILASQEQRTENVQ